MISCFYPNFISSLNSEKMGRPSPEPTPNNLIVNKNFQIRKVSSHTLGPGVMTVALSGAEGSREGHRLVINPRS